MTMPVSRSTAHPFPIEVTENQWQFIVRIPASQKERASRIAGRRWNPEIERWVYPKTIQAFEALLEEFQKDASVFEIRKPPSRRLPKPESQPHEDDQSMDEWKDLNEKTSEIHEKFNALDAQFSTLLGVVRTMEDLTRETHSLVKARPESDGTIIDASENENSELDFSQREDLKVIQQALVTLAQAACDHDLSFSVWMKDYEPLIMPDRFVTATHEKIKASIAQILGEHDYESADFSPLTSQLQQSNTLGLHPRENDRICNLLRAMNQHRNRFSHQAGFTEPERLSRSIIYLFNLALVWPHVASEPVEENDET